MELGQSSIPFSLSLDIGQVLWYNMISLEGYRNPLGIANRKGDETQQPSVSQNRSEAQDNIVNQ